MKRLQTPQKVVYEVAVAKKKIYLNEIVVVSLSKIYLSKNAKKICKTKHVKHVNYDLSRTLSFRKKLVICLIESPLKLMKNAFYFILMTHTVFLLKNLQKFMIKLFLYKKSITDKKIIADKFNEFFINLGPNLAAKIPPSNMNFDSYLPHVCTIFAEKSVTEEELKKTFFSLKPNKTPGYDDINVNIVKKI